MANKAKAQKNNKNKNENKEVVKKEEVKVTYDDKNRKIIDAKSEESMEVKKKNNHDKKKKNNDRFINFLEKVDNNRKSILLFVIGFLISTLLFRCILWPDRIATLSDGTQPVVNLKDKTITADDLYEDMKKQYSISILLNTIDDIILSKKFEENDEMKKEVKEQSEYYYNMYNQYYGYTKEQFLSNYGFASENDFLDSLRLDYRRNKYLDEYALGLVKEDEIKKYYDEEVFGDVNSKHILVNVKSEDEEEGLTDEEAKKLANEIIKKLDGGTSWDDVISEYKDKITNEELGFQAYNASLESSYLEECKNLKVGTYSKTPVLTSYGYHIVYKIEQKDKPSMDDIKDEIKESLADEKKNNDSNLLYKALISMREDNNLEFIDTKLGDDYKNYLKKYN